MPRREPIFNVPGGVMASIAVLAAMHAVRAYWLSDPADELMVKMLAFVPARYIGVSLPGGDVAKVTTFASHALLHVDITHLAINTGWLLIFGSIVARRVGTAQFLMLATASAIGGAALYLAMNWGSNGWMIGASGAISGLMGAATRFMVQPNGGAPWPDGRRAAALSLRGLWTEPRMRTFIGSWLVLNVVFGFALVPLTGGDGIAWEAHMGGFITGLLLLPWCDRPGRAPALSGM